MISLVVKLFRIDFRTVSHRNFAMGLIPDGWNDYVRTGKRINKTRFIAFKVPLREGPNHNLKITEENKWYPKLVVTLIPDIGIIIDITNTSKYYNPKDFLELGVDHKKILVEGHHIPSIENYETFHQTVKKFLQENKNNDKLIGVHCTHGLNRTGFLVCRYMIEEMKMPADEAISLFEDARGHKIRRENYIKKLKSLSKERSSSVGSDVEANSDIPNRRNAERHTSTRRNRRENPYDRPPSRVSPSDSYNSVRRDFRPPPRAPPPQHFPRPPSDWYAPPRPYASQNGNWRDPNHQYTSARSMQFNRIPNHTNRDQRRDPRDRSHPSRAQPNNSSRYAWRRDQNS